MSIADAIKRRESNKKSNNTSFDARLYVKEKYRKKKADEFGYDTLETDLNSLGTTIKGIYDGWQTEETMRNTRSSIESMYNRLTSYQDYRKTYGITDGEKDIADLVNNYKTTLDNWDSLASHYGEYKDADAYKKAEKAQADAKKRKVDMAGADLKVVQSEITDLESVLKKANDYNSKVSGYQTSESAAQRYSGRNGFVYNPDNENAKKLQSAQKELNDYLKSVGYSSVDDIKKALKDKQSFLEEAKVIQENDYFTKQAQEGYGIQGYEKYVLDEQKRKETAQANQPSAFEEGVIRGFTTTSDNPFSTAINNVIYDKRKDDSYQKPNEEWTQEAKYEFGARYLENPQKAYEYAAEYNNALANKKKDETKEKVGASSTDGFWGAIGNWMGARLTAPLGLADYLDDLTDIAAGRDTIVQEGVLTPFEYSQTVGESQASALNEWSGTLNENIPVLGGKGIGDVYSLGNSIVDSKVSTVTMGAYGTLLNYFGQAAASGVDDAMSRGADGKQALLYGTAQGLAEGIPEMISADKFLELGKKADIGFLGKVRKQAREEGTEELVTALLSNATDNAIMQDKSQFNVDVKNLMLKGLTEEEAKEKVWLDKAEGIAFDALGGYLSGVLGSVGKVAAITNAEKKTGANIRGNERVNETLELASLTPEESDAYNLYTEYAKKGVNAENIKDVQLGRLYNSAYYNAQDTLESEKTTDEQKVKAVKTLQKLSEVSSKNTDAIRKKELNVGESTTVTSTGNSATIEGIKVDSDKTTLVTNEGEISVDEMTLSDKDADLVVKAEGVAREYGEEMGSLFLEQYDGKADVNDYATSFNLAMNYAKHNFTQDMMLENRGVLSTSQVQAIHDATVHQHYVEQDNKVKAITEKQGKSKFIQGTFDDSIIDRNSKTTDGSKVNWSDLTPIQRNAIKFAQLFSKATGVNIKLIKSNVELGKHKGKNGSYDPKTNTIELDVYAGRIDAKSVEDSIIPTLSHEVTHWMKYKASAIYDSIREDVMKTLAQGNNDKLTETELVKLEMNRLKEKHPEMDVTPEDAIDELVARACEDMLSNSEYARELLAKMSKSEQTKFIDKVKETFENLIKWVNDLLSHYNSGSEEAQILRKYEDMLKKISKQWDSMLETAIETNQALQNEGIVAEQLVNGISEDGTTIVGKNNIQMSERTYAGGGRAFLEKWLSEQEGLTDADKKDILLQTDTIANLMKDIRENNELPEYARWASMDVVKDENGEKVLSVIVKNGDYAMNIDFSQVCKKRVALNAVLNAMVQSGDLNFYTLSETDVADLNAIIKKHEFEIACALCFVDSKRYRVGGWAESFCEGADKKKNGKMVHQYGFNEMVRSLVPKGSKIQIDEFNFTNRNIVGQPTSNLLLEMDDSELDFTLIDEILEREFKAGSKPTDLYAYAKAIKDNKELRKILNPAEIISSIGLDAIRLENKELYRLINRHQGTARPKFAHDVVAYTNDILKASNFTKEKAKMVGGVRCQSFSDFMANMVFDYVQFISELSAKELTSHSYTKEPLFVRLFGMTGMKINMSLVPKAVQMTPEQQKYFAILNDPNANKRSAEYQKAKRDYKKLTVNAGLDENGNYIWEDETFPYDIAMELVVDPRYSANCGTIAVGISDAHILKLLNDDKISMVIPYHKSGLNHIVAMMRNIDLYNDYTNTQNTRFANGKKLEKVPDFDFYGDLYGKDGKEGTHNPKQTADNYLKWCDEHNYIPKFEKSRIGRRFRDNPNYYKLLVDFRVYDTDGTYREQQPVKPIYPENEEFKDLILNGVVGKDGKVYGGLKQQQGTSDRLDAESKQIVDEFRNKLKEKYGKDVLGVKNSDRNSNNENKYSYDILINKPNIEISQIADVSPNEISLYKENRNLFAKKMIEIANKVGNSKNTNTATYLYCKDLGENIQVTRNSFKHGAARIDASYIAVCKNISNVLENSLVVNELKERENTNGGYVLLGLTESDDSYIVVRSIVDKKTWKLEDYNELYAIRKKSIKKEDVGFIAPALHSKNGYGTSSTISIANFLNFVNNQKLANSVLSLDVVNKLNSDREFDENVTLNLRYSDRDSEGNTLTKEQIEYFKDSKVRDADGNLLVVRHGTSEDFHIFDFSKAGKNGKAEGAGFYFSDEMEITKRYGDIQKEVYLNITKPMYNNKRTVKKAELTKLVNDLIDFDSQKWEQDWKDSFISNYVNTYEFQMSRRYAVQQFVNQIWDYNTNDQDLIFEIAQADGRTYANDTMKEFYDVLTDSIGYDGIIAEWSHADGKSNVYVTFNSEQSKYTSNANPTGNVDMRYSDRDYVAYDMTALLKETTIDKYLVEYASKSNPNYAQAYITYMRPNSFLELTTSGIGSQIAIENETKEFNREEFEDYTSNQIPIKLVIDHESGEVITHEGRHRMVALSREGIHDVPVLLFDYGNKYKKENIDEIKLIGQFNEFRTAIVTDAIPFNYANREAIIEKFGTMSKRQKTNERFGIRQVLQYSDRDNISVYDKLGETDRLIKDNEKLKEDVERLKGIIGGDEIAIRRFRSLADYLKKRASSNVNREELGDMLKEAYEFIQNTNDVQWMDVLNKTYDIANYLINQNLPVSSNYFKEVMAQIRKDTVSLTEEQKSQAEKMFGGYGNFHKAIFGRINITQKGTPLSEMWKQWAESYPAIFKADIGEDNIVGELIHIVDTLKSTSNLMSEFEREEAIRYLSTEIYNQFWNIASDSSDVSKDAKAQHRKMMEEMRKEYEKRQSEKTLHPVGETALKYEKLFDRVANSHKNEIKKVKQQSKERMDAYKENAERKTRIQSITSNALTLNKWLVKNSKDEHIHESLKAPVVNLLNAINFSSKRLLDKNIPTQKDISLSKALSQVKDMMVDASNGKEELVELYGHDMDEDIAKMVDSVYDIMRTVGDNEFVLNKMSLQSLQTLDKMVKTIKQSVSKMNKFHMVNHAKGIANLSQESMEYLDELGKAKIFDGLRGKAKKLLNWDNSLPCHAFKRFGEGGIKVFEAFQDGWDKFAFHIKKIIDYANDTYTSKEVKEWGETIKTFKILIPATEIEQADPNYKPKYQTVQMTIPQIMSLYCTQKREQGKNHILEGGIRVADFKTKKGEVVSQSDGAILTYSDVATIVSTLDAKQKLVADKLQRFMNTTCTEWGNEVSMLRFGYMAFGEDNYFPIQSDQNNLAVNDETEKNNSLFRLLNMSFTKGLVKGANNRIVISDIFDVFAQHTSDMAKYNALALPVLDAFKWYNYKEKITKGNNTFITKGVKQSIESAFGKDGQNYFTTFLKDLNGEKEVTRDTLGKHFFTSAKVASVGMNLRVMALQPTSYLRASAVIDNKYLIKAGAYVKVNPISLYSKLKKAVEKAEKHCGIALWKSMGYYDTNVQKGVEEQIKHQNGIKDKAIEWSMKGAEIADKATFGTLWIACEFEVRDKRKDLKVGSAEFYTEIGKRLRDVIYATQVVDSTMTRSHMMRGNSAWDKMLTAFASEPTLAYSMLQDAYMGLQLDARRLGKKEAFKKNGKKIVRVLVAYTMTNAMAALIESGFDAFRDEDDEEMDIEEFMKMYLTNFATDMSVIGKIPYFKEAVSIFSGYGSTRTDTQWVESFANAINGWMKVSAGEGNPITAIKHSFRSISYLTGLPFYNAYRDFMAALNKLDILTAEELEEMLKEFFS